MKTYKHFTLEERECLYRLLQEGKSQSDIAKHLDKNRSSICHEIKRNSHMKLGYLPLAADAEYKKRRKKCKPYLRFEVRACSHYKNTP